ncbi:MAG: tRNA (adenosine(37)-N6)-dimethylallyltransferase MiaA [Burkholderiales bacterium]|nr:tRNA (adenosine(37)-N6)-dimethylallyltransferase MiaA [Burkholderiales bacterium]
MGPTASGKSQLAMALAGHAPAEIVSVDSAQVYRGMDIGTAKPPAADRRQIPHHLIDIAEPTEAYSAARFCADALPLIANIAARGRVPLLVGGTMLYFKALRDGLAPLPAADAALRAEIEAEAARRGWPALHAELARLDPASADRIRPTDPQRLQRALEVCRLAGRPMSELIRGERSTDASLDIVWIALVPNDRAVLHRRIAERFDAMLAAGLVEELAALRRRYALSPDLPSMRCVGYRQAWQYLEGAIARDELRNRGIFATRQLAKRQLTWLRSWTGATRLDALAPDAATRAREAIAARS